MNPKLPARLAPLALLAALLAAGPVLAKKADRNQPMTIDAGAQSGSFDGAGKTVLSQGVEINQGTMELRSNEAELYMSDGEIVRAIFIGKQAKLKQQMDDGTWMNATANRIEYDIRNDTLTLIGDYKVESERGSNAGQRMIYNIATGNMQSGGDGTRVRTVIQPKNKTAAPAAKESK